MNKANSIIIYFIIFIFAAAVLRISGLVNITSLEFLAYLFMLAGIISAYYSFGKDKRGLLFIGSTVFLAGIIMYISTKFELEDTRTIIFPSVLFISGIGFLMLFFDDLEQKLYLVLSLLFIGGGLIYVFILREFALRGLVESLWGIIKVYWVFLIVIVLLVAVLRREN